MRTYSNSQMETFENCPLKYKLTYIDKVETEEEGIEAFVGSRVHDALEKLYKDLKLAKADTLDDLLAFYKEEWDKNWHDGVVIARKDFSPKHYFDTGAQCLRRYFARYEPFDQGIPVWIEEMVFFDLGKYRFCGRVDRLDRMPDGSLEIHDYKTSGRLPGQADVDADRQLALYQLAVQSKWRDADRVRLVWHYLVFDAELTSARTRAQLEELEKECLSVLDTMEAEREWAPAPSALCDWCPFWGHCPEKKHLVKIEALEPARAAVEDGFALVNRYASLKARERKLSEEVSDVKDRLVEYARREGLSKVRGSAVVASVDLRTVAAFPSRSSDGKAHAELVRIVKEAGLWEDYSALDARGLLEALEGKKLGSKLSGELQRFVEEREGSGVRLARLRDED